MGQDDFASGVREFRVHFNLSRERVAVEVGVTASAVSWWEMGLRSPNEIHRARFLNYARALNTPVQIMAKLDQAPKARGKKARARRRKAVAA